MMNSSLEDLVIQAKAASAGDGGIGIARGNEYAVMVIDFAATPMATIGAKKTGLFIPPNALIESGVMRVLTAVTGAFNLQLLAAEDVLPAQTNSTAGTVVDLDRVINGATEQELVLNLTAVGSAGLALVILRLFPG